MAITDDAVLFVIKFRGDAGELTPALTAVKTELLGVGAQADATAAQLSRVGNASELSATKVDAATAATSRHSSTSLAGVKSLSTLGLAFGAAGVAAGIYSVDVAASFDQVGAHILAGTDTTTAQLARIKQEAIDMSTQTGLSATSLLESYYSIASSVSDAAKAQAIWSNSLKFSAAYSTDAGVSTALLTGVTNAYHLSLNQIKPAQDDLSNAVKIGAAEAGDLAGAFATVDPIAAHMGVTVATTGAALAEMTNQGLSAAESGDRWRNLLQQLDAPTAQQIKAVNALGGSYSDLRIKNGDVLSTLQRLNTLMQSATPSVKQISDATGLSATKAKIWAQEMSTADGKARLLFGGNQVAAQGFFSLMNDGGQQMNKNLQSMANDSGTTERSFKVAMDNAKADFDKAKQGVYDLAIEIGGTLLPQAVNLEKALVPLSTHLAGLAKDHQSTTAGIADISGALLGLSAAGYAYLGLKKGLGGVSSALGDSFGSLSSGAALARAGLAGLGIEGGALVVAMAGILFAEQKASNQAGKLQIGYKDTADRIDFLKSHYRELDQAQKDELLTLEHESKLHQSATTAIYDHAQAMVFLNKQLAGIGPGYTPLPPDFGGNGNGKGSGSGKGSSFDLQTAISDATTGVQKWASLVYQDAKTHSASLQADEAELAKHKKALLSLQSAENSLTSIGGKTVSSLAKVSTSTDTLTTLTGERSKLEAQVQKDIAAGIKPSTDLTTRITSLSGEINRIQGYITGLEDPTKHVAINGEAAATALLGVAERGQELYLELGAAMRTISAETGGSAGGAQGGPEKGASGTSSESGGELISYATPAGFTGFGPAGTLARGGSGNLSVGGFTYGGVTYRIPTPAQARAAAPATPLAPGIQSLASGTPGQATTVGDVETAALQQLQSIMSAGNAVASAKLTVLVDVGKSQVDAENATTTAVNDATSVFQAQSAIQSARSDATIAGINDMSAVLSAQGQYAIDSLKSQQQISADLKKYGPGAIVGLDVHLAAAIAKSDQDAEQIAQTKAAQDRAIGAQNILITSDGLKLAQDKARADATAFAWTQKLDTDHLTVDTLSLAVQQDDQKIALLQLGRLDDISGDTSGFADLINGLNADNSKLNAAQGILGTDQNAADLSAAGNNNLLAGDSQQTAIDQAGVATINGDYGSRLAYLNADKSAADTQVQLLQAIQAGVTQTATNTGNGGDLVAALKTIWDAISTQTQTGGIGAGSGGVGMTAADFINGLGQAVNQALNSSLGPVAQTRNP